MSLREHLSDFEGSVGAAATRALDEYPEWGAWTYQPHMAGLKELWAEIRPQLKRDLEQVMLIDTKLQEMLTAFDDGDKAKGRSAA